jgi:hypothetical protein
MPISYTFDARASFIHVTATQELTMADYLGLRRAIEADAAIPSGSAVLVDLRGVTRFDLTGSDILALAGRKDSVERRARRIAVLVKDPLSFGLTRMYDLARGDGPPLRVFREIEGALHWALETS